MPQPTTGEFGKEHEGIHTIDTSMEKETEFWKKSISKYSSGLESRINSIEDLSNIPTDIIVNIIKSKETPDRARGNLMRWKRDVAPSEDIIADAKKGLEEDKLLFTSPEMSTIFTLKASEGHAHSAHGAYTEAMSNTTMDHILDTLESYAPNITKKPFSKEIFRNQNQNAVDNIVYAVEDWYKNVFENITRLKTSDVSICLTNPDGITPLNGFKFYDGLKINMLEYQRGFYFTSLMDNFQEIRSKGFQKYGHQMGGGESHLTNMSNLKRSGISLYDLAKMDYNGIYKFMNHISGNKKIDILTKLGIFIDTEFNWENFDPSNTSWDEIKGDSSITDIIKNSNLLGQYMREEKGHGVGDDIAIYLSSFLPDTIGYKRHVKTVFNPISRLNMHSRFIGGLNADQIDTLEKDTRLYFPGGQDEFVGKYFNELFKNACKNDKFRKAFDIGKREDGEYTLVDEDTIVDYTVASANLKDGAVHSSQRWFYKQPDKKYETCAVKEEIKHMYESAHYEKRDANLPGKFKFIPNKKSKNVNLTFHQIPLYQILNTFDERYDLIKDPSRREERICDFYSKGSEGETFPGCQHLYSKKTRINKKIKKKSCH